MTPSPSEPSAHGSPQGSAVNAPQGLVFGTKAQENLWKQMRNKCHVRLVSDEEFGDRAEIANQVSAKVDEGLFCPAIRGFLSSSKGNGVARFIPVLSLDSTLVYFACIEAIDEICADSAIENTFGGWSLGGKRRSTEKEQALKLFSSAQSTHQFLLPEMPADVLLRSAEPEGAGSETIAEEDDDGEIFASAPSSPYNMAAWIENWQEFWKLLAATEQRLPKDQFVVSLDIANFYDSIDLARLRRRLESIACHLSEATRVLFKYLENWNRSPTSFSSRGVPMDIVADMSRILANFFLVDFDAFFKGRVEAVGGTYLRYADDMTFTCPSRESASTLMFIASRKLHELGLNINTAKVQVRSREEFRAAWGFDIMDQLGQDDRLQEGLLALRGRWEDPGFQRRDTAVRRSLSLLRDRPDLGAWRQWVYQNCFRLPEFISRLKHSQMNSFVTISDNPTQAVNELCEIVMAAPFTEPKTHLLRYLEKQRRNAEKIFGHLFDIVRKELLESDDPCLELAAKNSL